MGGGQAMRLGFNRGTQVCGDLFAVDYFRTHPVLFVSRSSMA